LDLSDTQKVEKRRALKVKKGAVGSGRPSFQIKGQCQYPEDLWGLSRALQVPVDYPPWSRRGKISEKGGRDLRLA